MPLSRILLVEGKRSAKTSFRDAVAKKYDTTVASSGNQASDLIISYQPDVIICDSTNMRTNGERICQRIKKIAPEIPLIHCLREGETVSQELTMADEMLVLPFTSRKLINRIRTVIPASETDSDIVRAGNISLYFGKRSVGVDGKGEFKVTPKMITLLHELILNVNEVVSRKQLMEKVWETSYVGDTRTLDVHIRWLREIVEEDASDPKRIVTVRSRGYSLIL